MREILFRAKRVDNGEWAYGDLWHNNSETMIIDQPATIEYDVIPETIGQYTGLCDKNGKKIFEGDIVKGGWNTIFKIYFDDCYLQFRAKIKSGLHREIDYYGDSKRLEIIGNIYDNPELLEEN